MYTCGPGETGPEIFIAPEFAPINPSAWYAYRITTDSTTTRSVTITQRYLHGQHRYRPWTRKPGGEWQLLPDEAQTLSADRATFEFTVEIPAEGLEVAAQPILNVADSQYWSGQLAESHGLQTHELLRTGLGLSLNLYDSATPNSNGMILLLGRQHPPELTGAYAYQDFVERLFEGDELAQQFRQNYRLVLVPMVNPDGVELGHWRMNRGGMDLNRDWGPFTQPETRAIAEWLEQANRHTPFILLLDFHSTWNDVLYGQHLADSPIPTGFNQAWYEAISSRLGNEAPAWSGQNNPGLPTAKSWARRLYGVSAITYEVGDRTARNLIQHKARVSAEELMRVLLDQAANAQSAVTRTELARPEHE